MKVSDLSEFHIQFDMPSAEAFRAQRMAELEQMAKYRALKLQQYKDWSDPIKRAAFQAKIKADEAIAKVELREMFKGDPDIEYAKIAVRPLTEEQVLTFKMSPLYKIPPNISQTRWQRLWRWLRSAIFLSK